MNAHPETLSAPWCSADEAFFRIVDGLFPPHVTPTGTAGGVTAVMLPVLAGLALVVAHTGPAARIGEGDSRLRSRLISNMQASARSNRRAGGRGSGGQGDERRGTRGERLWNSR